MFIILRENSEVNPNTGGSEDENHAHTSAGKPHTHTGHLSHCIQIDPGSAGRQADHQPGEEVDLHQPCRAQGGEDRQADAVKVCTKNPPDIRAVEPVITHSIHALEDQIDLRRSQFSC